MITRKNMIHGMATGGGALLGTRLFPDLAQAAGALAIRKAS
jgi:hypothetical protein